MNFLGRKKKMKKKTKGTRGVDNLFFNIFAGELVQITTDVRIKTVADSEEGSTISEFPVTIQGYLLDQDLMYYYLGESPGAVSTAITITSVKAITIVESKTEFDEILDDMPEPKEKEEFN